MARGHSAMILSRTTALIVNSIITGSRMGIRFSGPCEGEDITETVGEHLTISHNDVWDHSAYDYYAEVMGMTGPFRPLPGTGEINVDPRLDGRSLQPGPPCIDAADNLAVPKGITCFMEFG